ncbi:MAG: hypothetical protein GX136_02810 [Clostridiales bacterium]|nr:hypothetical protein [Clostridiales bacterium]
MISEEIYFLQIGENEKWNNSEDIDFIWVQTSINSMVPGQAIYLKKVVLFTEKATASNYKGDYNSHSTGHSNSFPLTTAKALMITSVAICFVLLRKEKATNNA